MRADASMHNWHGREADLLLFEGAEQAHGTSHKLRPGSVDSWRGGLLRQSDQRNEPQQIDLLVIHLAKVLRAATTLAGKDHLQAIWSVIQVSGLAKVNVSSYTRCQNTSCNVCHKYNFFTICSVTFCQPSLL